MAFTFDYLRSEFTSLVGTTVDLVIFRDAILANVSIAETLLDQPEGIRWIDQNPDPTLRVSFTTAISPLSETALDTEVANHTGPILGKVTTRSFVRAVAPTGNDDASSPEKFITGDSWTDTVTERQYTLAKMTPGSAVWKRSDVGGNPSASIASIDSFEEMLNGAPHDADRMLITLAGGGLALLPIGNVFATALNGFLTGYNLSWINVSTVQVAAGSCAASDQSGFVFSAGTLQANITASGVGGLDTGSEAADTWYYVHAIGDSTKAEPVALILSVSTTPTFPLTYDRNRIVGMARNNGSSNFMRFFQQGNSRDRVVWWDEDRNSTPQRVLSGGGASVFSDVDCSVVVSPLSDLVYLILQTSNSGSGIRLRPNGFQDSAGTVFIADGSAVEAALGTDASQVIEYEQAGSTTLTADVRGYMEHL